MSKVTKLKAAVIGVGIVGRQHASALHTHPDVAVTAVADVRLEAAEAVAEQVGAEPFVDYREMLKQHSPDVVVVATPDPFHREPVVSAAEAGVPTIVLEKPFATSVADAEAMVDVLERRGTRLFVNFANRATPLDIATRYVTQNRLVGEVVYGEMRLEDQDRRDHQESSPRHE